MSLGKELVADLNNGKIVVSDVGATIPGIGTLEEKFQFLYEACSAAVKDDLNTAKVAVAIQAAGLEGEAHWTRQNLAQIIWLLVQEVSSQEALYTKLKDLVQDLQKAALVSKTELMEVGPLQFLIDLGVVPFKKPKENTVRADLFYRIKKFNALREENEGFSKMLVCLQSFGAAAAESADSIPQVLLEIKSLIGYFDLDPNKVAALVLDIWQDQWHNTAYLQLLPLFSAKAVTASLAFIFISYQKDGEVPPDNLYRMSVQLLKANTVTLGALWTHLSHSDSDMEELQQDALKAAYGAFLARNALNRGGEAEAQPGQDNLLNMSTQQAESLQAAFRISAATLNLDPRKLPTDALQRVWALNQKLELLKIAFEMEQLDLAWVIYGGLKATGVEPCDYPPVNAWMARRVLAGMTSIYAPAQQHQVDQVPLPSMSQEAQNMLDRMGLSFSCSNELFIRLVCHWRQLLQHYQSQAEVMQSDQDFPEEVVTKVSDELVRRIFPGMALMTPEPFCAAELWSLLELLPYRARFEVYDAVQRVLGSRGRDTMEDIALHAASDNVERMLKKVSGRMGFDRDPSQIEDASAKKDKDKSVKALTRNLAKCSHANPIVAADYLVKYVAANGSHIDSLTDAMADFSDLMLDVMTYRVIKRLTTLKQRYKPDNVLIADTFANASRFAAVAARKLTRDGKFESGGCIETHALLQMVLNAAKKQHTEVFAVLGDLMSICAAVHTLEDVGDAELPTLAGGEVLRTVKIINKEVRLASKAARAGMEHIREAITTTHYGNPLAVPLFITLAQNRNLNVIGLDKGVGSFDRKLTDERLRIVSGRYDYANKLMMQYAEFLRLAINKDTYRDLIPSLGDLLSPDKYALEPEVAFLLYRPVLSRVPFPDPPDPKDEEDGEIPDGPSGGETPMEVEREDTAFGEVRWSNLLEAVETHVPLEVTKGLSKPLYILFWRLTLSDIVSAAPEYSKQIEGLHREQAELEQEMKAVQEKDTAYPGFTNSKYIASPDDRRLAVRHFKNKVELLKDQIRLLERERNRMEERKSEGIKLFRRWKQHLLADTIHEQTADDFLAHCILPRCLLTPEDAMYCAAFIRRMTLEDTPFFSFLYFVQRLIPNGLPVLLTLTEAEADNFAIFLREILQSINGWWLDQKNQPSLLAKQAFRMDARSYNAPTAAKHASAATFNSFALSSNVGISGKLLANFKANSHTTVNERAAVNSMLVLNKIRTVCPAIRGIAASLQTALKPIFTRLEPKKDQQGNFIESPVPMYTFAIRCHNDLAKTVLDNLRFDTGLTTTVPAIRLYEAPQFQPKYATQPTPQAPPEPKAKPRAPSAGTQKPAAQAEADASAAAAAPKPPRESLHAPKLLREGHARPSTTARGAKEPATKDTPRDGREGRDSREGKEPSARDGRDRGREISTRGAKEHADRAHSTREGKDGGRASGKAADDQQQQQEQKLRAAALKATANGTSGDAAKERSSARRDDLANGTKPAAANGAAAAAVTGSKRRAPDSDITEARGSKAARTDDASGPQPAATPSTRSSTRRTEALPGNKAELRADAPEYKPSPAAVKLKSEPASKQPATEAAPRIEGAERRPREGKAPEAAANQPSDAGAGPSKPSGGSTKPPIHPEATTRSAGKRARDAEAVTDAAKPAAPAEGSKGGVDEQEPKRRKHKPIAWAAPPADDVSASQQIVSERKSSERRSADEAPAHDQLRRSSSDIAKAPAKPEPAEPRARGEKERPRAKTDDKVVTEAKHDGRRDDSDRRHAQHDSRHAEPEGRHLRSDQADTRRDSRHEHESERAQRSAQRRDTASPRDSQRPKTSDGSRGPSTKQSASRSEEEKRTAAVAAPPEEQEDGEVQMALADAQPDSVRAGEENGGIPAASPRPSPGADDGKDDSDGKESKRGHKKKDSKEKKKKDHKKEHKKDKEKDPEKARAKAEKKAAKEVAKAKAAASAAPSDTAAQPASLPPAPHPQSSPLAAAPAAEPASAGQGSAAARLSSSIARTGNMSSPTRAIRVEDRAGGNLAPSSSPRQAPLRHPSQRGSDCIREDSLPRGGRTDRGDAHSAGERGEGPPAQYHFVSQLPVKHWLLLSKAASKAEYEMQALPPGDLRHLLSRGKSNTDEVSRSDLAEPRAPLRGQGNQQQRQAPRIVHDPDPPRSRLANSARRARR